jgi:hypothetical protein
MLPARTAAAQPREEAAAHGRALRESLEREDEHARRAEYAQPLAVRLAGLARLALVAVLACQLLALHESPQAVRHAHHVCMGARRGRGRDHECGRRAYCGSTRVDAQQPADGARALSAKRRQRRPQAVAGVYASGRCRPRSRGIRTATCHPSPALLHVPAGTPAPRRAPDPAAGCGMGTASPRKGSNVWLRRRQAWHCSVLCVRPPKMSSTIESFHVRAYAYASAACARGVEEANHEKRLGTGTREGARKAVNCWSHDASATCAQGVEERPVRAPRRGLMEWDRAEDSALAARVRRARGQRWSRAQGDPRSASLRACALPAS